MEYSRSIAKEITKIQFKFKTPTKQYEKEILKIAPDYPKKYFKSWYRDCIKYKEGIQDSSSGPGTEYFLGYLDAIKELNYDIDLVIRSTKKWKSNAKRSHAIDKWLRENCTNSRVIYPDDIEKEQEFFEGAKKQIIVNAYERSQQARQKCIDKYGYKCTVCNFDFEKTYGKVGKNFIHVHHIKPLSEIDEKYSIDPIEDLRPVCPNCHAMLHKRRPAYSINEIKNLINDKKL